MKGKFITFEGSEGSGKSTQIAKLKKYLQKQKQEILFVREPGGVKLSESIRRILLDVKSTFMSMECETLLYMAARAQLVEEVIKPALKEGKVVLCDRFLDSTIVYQGYAGGVDLKTINSIGKFATQSISPDVTFFFDIDVKEGFKRINRKMDRIEQRSLNYHNKVRSGYLSLAKKNTKRIKVINAQKSIEQIQNDIEAHINKLFGF